MLQQNENISSAVMSSCRPSIVLLLLQSQASTSLSSCVLDFYHNNATFLRCLDSNTDNGGVVCLSVALSHCYASLRLANHLNAPSRVLRDSVQFLGSLSQNVSRDWTLPSPQSNLAKMISDTSRRLKPYAHTSNITCNKYHSFNTHSTLDNIP